MSKDTEYQLFVRQQIERNLNSLVSQVQALVDQTNIYKRKMEKHQLSNLLGVALETSSVAVVTNFIRYQVGRDNKKEAWRSKTKSEKKSFGEKLVIALEELEDTAKIIAADCKKNGLSVPNYADEEIWMELVRQYIGQLNRYFYYRKSMVETGSKGGS